MSKSNFEQISHKRLLGLLGIIAYFLLMFGNGRLSLTHPAEVFYFQIRERRLIYFFPI